MDSLDIMESQLHIKVGSALSEERWKKLLSSGMISFSTSTIKLDEVASSSLTKRQCCNISGRPMVPQQIERLITGTFPRTYSIAVQPLPSFVNLAQHIQVEIPASRPISKARYCTDCYLTLHEELISLTFPLNDRGPWSTVAVWHLF
jgi:hypothetical protein